MNRIEELIRNLCPDGVKCDKIKNVFLRLKGTPITASKMKEIASPDGEIRIFAGGKTIIDAHEKDIPKANITRVPAVLVQSRGIIDVIYYDKPFTFKNEMWAYSSSNPITTKFLYYVLKNNIEHFREAASGMGALPQISLPVTDNFYVTIPPLEVQQEIVRILDQFAQFTTELTAELSAELSARKEQYEYYRNALFPTGGCNFTLIKDIAITNIGLATSVTRHKRKSGILLLHNSDIQQNRISLKQYEYISEEFAQKNAKKLLQKDDIITVHTGDVGTSAVIDGPYVGAIGFTTITTRIIDKAQVTPQYLCHYLNSHRCKTEIASMTISDRSNLNQKSFEMLTVPLPPLPEQRRIVSILDRFDALCNDLTSGLSAEIAARQKQYEYYRDKLLTFKELEA